MVARPKMTAQIILKPVGKPVNGKNARRAPRMIIAEPFDMKKL
jgi:hypothetical protein